MTDPTRPARLRGPIAYLNRDTEDDRHIKRLRCDNLPLVLSRVPNPSTGPGHFDAEPAGEVTAVEIIDNVVWADATMPTADPSGTRYSVGIDVARADIVFLDAATGAEVPVEAAMFSDVPPRLVFIDADLAGVTITRDPAWPDAYLEVLAP